MGKFQVVCAFFHRHYASIPASHEGQRFSLIVFFRARIDDAGKHFL